MQLTKKIVGLSAVVLFALIVGLTWRVGNACDTRFCKLGAMMPKLASIEKEVEIEQKSFSIRARGIQSAGYIDFGYVNSDGSIVMVNVDSKLVILAHPVFQGGQTVWQCMTYPNMPQERILTQDCGYRFR